MFFLGNFLVEDSKRGTEKWESCGEEALMTWGEGVPVPGFRFPVRGWQYERLLAGSWYWIGTVTA